MKFKESTKSRVTSVVWLVILLLLSLFWWIACMGEAYSKRGAKKGKANYFVILFDAYRSIYAEFINTCKTIKTGETFWK